MKFYDDFVAYFTSKSYSINTIGRHVKELKIIMCTSRDEGYHNNGNIESRKFKVVIELAGITEAIEVEQMAQGRLVKTIVPKNELVKTHTASHSQKLYRLHTNQLQ